MVVVKPFKVYPQHSRKLVELDPVPLRPENTVVGCVIHAVCGRVCKPFCLNSTAVGWDRYFWASFVARLGAKVVPTSSVLAPGCAKILKNVIIIKPILFTLKDGADATDRTRRNRLHAGTLLSTKYHVR